MKPEQVRAFLDTTPTDFIERCTLHSSDFNAMVSSPAWALLTEWNESLEDSLKHNAVEALTLEEREEARNDLMALRKMQAMPLELAKLLRAIASTPTPENGISPESV